MLIGDGVADKILETPVTIEATISERLLEARKAALALPAFPGL